MPRLNSLTFRLIAIAAVWTVLGLALGGIVLSDTFRQTVEKSFDDRLANDMEGLIAAAVMETPGSVALEDRFADPRFERIYSGWYWQIEPEVATQPAQPQSQPQSQPQPPPAAPEAAPAAAPPADVTEPAPQPPRPLPLQPQTSRSLWDTVLETHNVTAEQGVLWGYADGPDGQRLRVLERRIRLPGTAINGQPQTFRFLVAGDLAEIQDDVTRFDATLAWSFGALGLGLIAAIIIQVRLGLLPLRRVSHALARIREGRARRLEGEFPAEIAPLAAELNSLIDYSAEVVARARGNVANLAHFLKTPITVLANEVSGQQGPLADAVRRQVSIMRRQVDHYLSRARAAGSLDVLGNRAEVAQVLRDLVRVLKQMHAAKPLDIALDVSPALAFRGDREDLEEMAGNLIDNACKWANARVSIEAQPGAGGRFVLAVGDDGPGLAPEERDRAVRRGEKLDETVPGSGLGLSIVRDIAKLYGGEFTLGQSPLGGLEARLELPVARS
ncbi:MAG: sensor histidine kinase [Alphaproteobacteria bacterium]